MLAARRPDKGESRLAGPACEEDQGMTIMRTNNVSLSPALGFLLVLTACGGGSDGSGDAGITSITGVTAWRGNPAAEDLLDHWSEPEALEVGMALEPVAPENLDARRRALESLVRAAAGSPDATGTRLRNVRLKEVEILGERDGITYGRWTGGPADTLDIEFDFRFAEGLDAESRARMERAGKAWSRRILDDFPANTVPSGTRIDHDPTVPGAESRTVTFEEEVPVDDVLIAVLYTGQSSKFSTGGAKRRNATADDYEPWLGSIVLSRRHVDDTGVMAHEIGHAIGLTNFSGAYWTPSGYRYVNFEDHTFVGPEAMRANGGEPVPFQWVNRDNRHVAPNSSGATPDYTHLGVCDSIMAYCRNRDATMYPSEIDFAILADIGYELLDAATAADNEVYGYGAWGRYSAWGAGVERDLELGRSVRDSVRAGADAFGITPAAALAEAFSPEEGDATWVGSLLGVDLGRGAMLPPVYGDAALVVDLASLEGAARFGGLTVLVDGTETTFRSPNLEYAIRVDGNAFSDEAGRVDGGFFGPAHEEMAGVLDDRDPGVNLLAGFGGTR